MTKPFLLICASSLFLACSQGARQLENSSLTGQTNSSAVTSPVALDSGFPVHASLNGAGTPLSISYATPGTNRLVLLAVEVNAIGGLPATVSGSALSWVKVGPALQSVKSPGLWTEWWYAWSASATSEVITVSLGSGGWWNFVDAEVLSFSGAAQTPGATATATDNGTTTGYPTVTINSSAAGSVLLAAGVATGAGRTLTAGSTALWSRPWTQTWEKSTWLAESTSVTGSAGPFTLGTNSGAQSDTWSLSAIEVKAGASAGVAVAVGPKTASIAPSASQQLTATVTGSANTAVTWSVQETGGGAVTTAGAYTAPSTAGTYHVIATSQADATKSDSATMTVTAAPAVAITVSPKTVSLSTSGAQQFIATVTGSANMAATWSVQEGAAGGAVTAAGAYTAPATAGTYHVIATSQADATKKDTATVTVTAPPPVVVTINPKSASLTTGGTNTFTCAVSGSADTTCTWSVTEGAAGGTVSSGGAYTAPASAGTYHVVAKSHADATKSDTATITVNASGAALVNVTDVHQKIDGFGAADVWSGALTDAQADLFFSQSSGIGLSILRVGIADNGTFLDGGNGSAMSDAKKAAARGAIVWGAPWSPTPAWKDSNNENTGSLLAAHYGDWANSLVSAYNLAKSSGVNLYGISVQNEPDYNTNGGYAMCLYSAAQMRDFIKVLGPKLAALSPRPKLMAAESSGWAHLWGGGYDYVDTITADPTALSYLDIIATHQYDVYANVPAHALPANLPLWETEVSGFDGPSTDINNGVSVAGWIHAALVTGNASAWHYWWLIGLNNDNEGLLNPGGVITKRLYTMGNFSKFVRPGFVRIGTTGAPTGVSLSAYRDPASGSIAVVAINTTAAAVSLSFDLSGATASSLTPFTTSATLNLAAQTAITPSGGRFTATLPATSVTTFAGTAN